MGRQQNLYPKLEMLNLPLPGLTLQFKGMKLSPAHFSCLAIADIFAGLLLLSSINFHVFVSSVNYWFAEEIPIIMFFL